MTDLVASDQIRAYVERIERLEEERKAIARDIAEVYAEAKGNGYDRKALKQVVRIRAMDHNARMELEALVDLYLSALGMASSLDDDDDADERRPHVHVHVREELPDHDPSTGEIIEIEVAGEVVGESNSDGVGNTDPVLRSGGAEATRLAHNQEVAGASPAPATNSGATQPEDRSGQSPAPSEEPAPVANDYSRPNPICQDPEDCGVHASWNHTCGTCLRRAAEGEARVALQ